VDLYELQIRPPGRMFTATECPPVPRYQKPYMAQGQATDLITQRPTLRLGAFAVLRKLLDLLTDPGLGFADVRVEQRRISFAIPGHRCELLSDHPCRLLERHVLRIIV
jgi:hypothetical protein